MKTVTIGRGDGCNIIIDDEMMSRRHAIIKIPTFGGMEIVDMSKNGTFVNGVRIRSNVPIPISRKDVVNFADVQTLDWSKVPDPLKYYKLGALIVGGLIVLILAILLAKSLFSGSKEEPVKPATEQVTTPAPAIEKEAESAVDEPAQESSQDEAEPQNPAASDDKDAQSEYVDPVREFNKSVQVNKAKREAEEKARQQKAKEQQKQKQKDSQKQKDASSPSKDKSSGKENKTVVI